MLIFAFRVPTAVFVVAALVVAVLAASGCSGTESGNPGCLRDYCRLPLSASGLDDREADAMDWRGEATLSDEGMGLGLFVTFGLVPTECTSETIFEEGQGTVEELSGWIEWRPADASTAPDGGLDITISSGTAPNTLSSGSGQWTVTDAALHLSPTRELSVTLTVQPPDGGSPRSATIDGPFEVTCADGASSLSVDTSSGPVDLACGDDGVPPQECNDVR